MNRSMLTLLLLGVASPCLAQEPAVHLPTPEYHRLASDPDWLVHVVQFHGHLGPAVVAGARIGMAGLHAVDAQGYFDVEVACEGPLARPPQSCFLDGLQMGTGATLGKRTLSWTDAEQLVVRFENTQTGQAAELRPTPALMDLLRSFKPQPKALTAGQSDHHQPDAELEAIARRIAALSESELAAVKRLDAPAAR